MRAWVAWSSGDRKRAPRLRNDQGLVTVGHVRSTEVLWDDWRLFSDGRAFSPKLASMGEQVLIAYRDGEQGRGKKRAVPKGLQVAFEQVSWSVGGWRSRWG